MKIFTFFKQLLSKWFLASFLLFLTSYGLMAQTATKPSGTGTLDDPYLIASLNNLYWVASDIGNSEHNGYYEKYLKQTANIDAAETQTWFSGQGWEPIGTDMYTFNGNYDGQGFTISNLYINRLGSLSGVGLFGSVSSTGIISNLGVTNVSVTGNFPVGGLAGYVDSGTIISCYTTGSIVGGDRVGGLVGHLYYGYINNSYSTCSITEYDNQVRSDLGGLVGLSEYFEYGNPISILSGTITNSYAVGTVTPQANTTRVGGLLGSGMTATGCFWDTQTTGQASSAGGTGKATAQMKTASTFTGASWSTSFWGMVDGYYPFLKYQLVVYSQAVSSVSYYTATGNGTILNFGKSSSATAHGVCWNTTGKPTISDSKIDLGATSTLGAFTVPMTGLADNTTYKVRTYVTNATTGTSYGEEVSFTTPLACLWTGAVNSDWNEPNNWVGLAVPTSSNNVVIPSGKTVVIGATTTADCKNLTVEGSLTIQSSASGTGSLIVYGTSTGSITAEQYMTGNKWHLVSPIVSGQSVAAFLSTNAVIATKTGTPDKRGLMDYNTVDNKWNDYYLATDAVGTMDAGKGYSARVGASDGIISFVGTLTTGDKNISVKSLGEGWNCIGNPYTSAINVNTVAGADNFLKTNAVVGHSCLDPDYAGLYLWNQTSNRYDIINNAAIKTGRYIAQNYIAPGQGFFIKTIADSVFIKTAMQSHQNNTDAPLLKSAKAPWSSIQLNIANGATIASTVIAFNSDMTKGLDPTYDAGLLRGTTGVNLYSRLVQDNGVDFAIQALPSAEENLVIPIGVESKDGGNVTFSAKTVELPANTSVMIEDKTTGTLTSLTDGGVYTATVEAGVKGIGRFYIHTKSASTTTDIKADEAITISAYANNKIIYINGKLAGATAQLFDINGKQVDAKKLSADNVSTLDENKLVDGVYVLRVITVGKVYSFKVVLQ